MAAYHCVSSGLTWLKTTLPETPSRCVSDSGAMSDA